MSNVLRFPEQQQGTPLNDETHVNFNAVSGPHISSVDVGRALSLVHGAYEKKTAETLDEAQVRIIGDTASYLTNIRSQEAA